ncbi:mRNA interferase MazF [Paraburkholderia unamae]|uniref:type II toxin-antitoxin system PemK/MazF family toxin n=1 Tax=Paraburkholderia unamae TaxID=219649 RepID=UPI000DC399CE|nr:type II toxin-antitoxin system PemK/MazF family toxin [Paraburkholderia unamae]RAR53880.1 mRNA interferase MazF [Paraburkholderia unamae]
MKDGIPDAGDIVYLYVGPSKGNEQDGHRPVVVVTDHLMNEVTGRFIGLPVTSRIRGWATEIPVSALSRPSVALVDQLRSWSYVARECRFEGEVVSPDEMSAVKHAIREFMSL